tara:strand:+ start:4397 stop:4912 length:516 start_codon:yes stop_codon:yes gene_type:complete
MTHDPINSPAHYAEGRQFEPIAVIEDWDLNYRLGNALKYISRAGRKVDGKEDLQKAIWYLQREIDSYVEPDSLQYEDVLEYYGQTTDQKEAWPDPYAEWVDDDNWECFWDDSLGPVEVSLSQSEIDEILDRKALHQFANNEIVATVEKRGLILGIKKDGSTCELGPNGNCK